MRPRTQFLILVAALVVPLAAGAQSFRCTGKDGKKYYGSAVPPQCVGQPIEQLNAQGNVIRRMDPEGDEKQRAAKAAEQERKRQEDAQNREEMRRNRALLATYTSEKDIEEARGRALAENQKAIQEVEGRIAAIKKRQAGYAKEMEFYQDAPKKPDEKGKPKPAASNAKAPKPPPKLVEDMKAAEVDLKLQEEALASRQKQVEAINAKYDEDKQRFLALTKPARK